MRSEQAGLSSGERLVRCAAVGLLAGGTAILLFGLQILFSSETYGALTGKPLVYESVVDELWPPYCAASVPGGVGAWLYECAGEFFGLVLGTVALQACLVVLPGGRHEDTPTASRRLGLSWGDWLALAGAVVVFNVKYAFSRQQGTLGENLDALGLLAASVLVGRVVFNQVWHYRPDLLRPRNLDLLLLVAALVVASHLVAGAFVFVAVAVPAVIGGLRWPLALLLIAGDWWLRAFICRRRGNVAESSPGCPVEVESPYRRKVLVALLSITVALSTIEIITRWVLASGVYGERSEPAASDEGVSSQSLELGDLMRASANRSLVYELRPNLSGDYAGVPLRTNAQGMRGAEVQREKPAGTFRIAGIGDSVMFGWGVPLEQSHLSILGELLEEADPARRYEVLNFGVPGYNTVMEAETYRARAREFSPDLVVLCVVYNDADLPNYLRRPQNALCLHRCFFAGLVRRALVGADPYVQSELVEQEFSHAAGRVVARPGRTPLGARVFSGEENAFAALGRLRDQVKADGAQLLVTFDYPDLDHDVDAGALARRIEFQERALEEARRLGIAVADPRQRIVTYLRTHRLKSRDLCVAATDSHPNAIRHRLMAEELCAQAQPLIKTMAPR